MAERRLSLTTGGEHGGHPSTLLRQLRPTDRVDPPPYGVKPSASHPVFDSAWGKPKRQQLLPGHHAVLPSGQIPGTLRRSCGCPPHSGDKCTNAVDSPPL